MISIDTVRDISPERRKVWESWDKQIRIFAKHFLSHANLPSCEFTLMDVGCGIGSALREIHSAYPKAQLFGCDLDTDHINECLRKHGGYGNFFQGNALDINDHYDVIYVSNVLEHLPDWQLIVKQLLSWCTRLYIFLPYKETFKGKPVEPNMGLEHWTSFNERSFDCIALDGVEIKSRIIRTPGAWGHPLKREIGLRIKALIKRKPFDMQRQILFAITNLCEGNDAIPQKAFLRRLRVLFNLISLKRETN